MDATSVLHACLCTPATRADADHVCVHCSRTARHCSPVPIVVVARAPPRERGPKRFRGPSRRFLLTVASGVPLASCLDGAIASARAVAVSLGLTHPYTVLQPMALRNG